MDCNIEVLISTSSSNTTDTVLATTALEMLPSPLVVTEMMALAILPAALSYSHSANDDRPEPTAASAFVKPPLKIGSDTSSSAVPCDIKRNGFNYGNTTISNRIKVKLP